MNLLSDIITYIRRIVKTPSNSSLSDNLIIDYINRFWIMDVDARMQLYDLKTTYQFETIPQVCDYNMPLYTPQSSTSQSTIAPYPVYQGFTGTAYVNGIEVQMYTQKDQFWKVFPNYVQSLTSVETGDGTTTSFSFTLPYFPAIPGHVDMTGIIYNYSNSSTLLDPIFATQVPNSSGTPTIPYANIQPGVFITYQNNDGSTTTITDSGVFLSGNTSSEITGILIQSSNPGTINPNPFGYTILGSSATANSTVNYITGSVTLNCPTAPADGTDIQAQCYFYEQGIPRAILQYNNTLTIRPPPDIPYLIVLDAYLTPAAFLDSSQAIQFGYMCEYLARGAARKILTDTGDVEQFMFYEPLFKEQETLVWKRSQRIITSQRTPTIFSSFQGAQASQNSSGIGAT